MSASEPLAASPPAPPAGPVPGAAEAVEIGVRRCVAHPSRLASDQCPHCSRRRCAADAVRTPARCAVCQPATRPRSSLAAALVAAGLAAMAVALVGGDIATQYVGDKDFDLVAPLILGVAAGALALVAAGLVARCPRLPVGVLALAAALIGTGLSFRLVPGGTGPLHPAGQVLGPYVAALVGGLVGVGLAPVSRSSGPRRSHGRRRAPGTSGR